MGFHGVLSKGCQRCRQRKVKCDQQKPHCLKCAKSGIQCPGYRNLNEAMFRDESERITRKARQIQRHASASPEDTYETASNCSVISNTPLLRLQANSFAQLPWKQSLSRPMCQPINELGANFFFTSYAFNQPPFTGNFQDWLVQSYSAPGLYSALRSAIEAVGMSSLANISHSTEIATLSRRQYGKALIALKESLQDPQEVIADTTLMAVITFGLYETINLDNLENYYCWSNHIDAATSLLALRGEEQFTRERGGQLYIQIRTEILSACLLQDQAVPPALVQATYDFATSGLRQRWRDRKVASPGSTCEISFRLINLQAAFKSGTITDKQAIREAALDIDNDLESWRACASPEWTFVTIDTTDPADKFCFEGKKQIYSNHWIAAAWNNWRTLRMLTNQIILQNEITSTDRENEAEMDRLISMARTNICKSSVELCISAASFSGNPRIFSVIRPLYVVAREPVNTPNVRSFAAAQLRRIEDATGIRQAGLLADLAERDIAI